jgi:FkbM family methyltransferase
MDPHSAWKAANGDETYALEWDINSESLVWEIGGFEGRWAAQMAEKYNPQIEIFEPQGWAVDRLKVRFKHSPKVRINPFGLWVMDANLPLYNYETDGASLLAEGARIQVVQFKDVYSQVDSEIDVGLMNIEGAEFVLIPYMLGNDLMKHFRYFWCQFHLFVPESEWRIATLREKMKETHDVLWDFFPTAVAWKRR